MLQEPLPHRVVPLGQLHEHGNQMIPGKDQSPVLVRCVRLEPYPPQGEMLGQRAVS